MPRDQVPGEAVWGCSPGQEVMEDARAMTKLEIRYKNDLWMRNWMSVYESLEAWQRGLLKHSFDIILGRVRDGWPTRGETVEEC